jgi:hypothetical protein
VTSVFLDQYQGGVIMKLSILIPFILLSTNLYAEEVILDSANKIINIGNIRNIEPNKVFKELKFVTTENTPKKVAVSINFKIPALVCTSEHYDVCHRTCGELDYGCDEEYVCTVCDHYEFSDNDGIENAINKTLKIKFKSDNRKNKHFSISLSKSQSTKYYYGTTESVMDLTFSVQKTDEFSSIKMRQENLFRDHTTIILK